MNHTLTEVDETLLVGVCAECGPNSPVLRRKVQTKKGYGFLCRVVKQRTENTHRGSLWWERNLLRYYNLTPKMWHQMLISQSGRCAICSNPMVKPFVDHNHATDEVRGLLCLGCNAGLGQFQDDPVRMLSAVAYLNRT